MAGFIYSLRNEIERYFVKMKQRPRFATRSDKTAASYLGFALLTAIRLRVRRIVNMA